MNEKQMDYYLFTSHRCCLKLLRIF